MPIDATTKADVAIPDDQPAGVSEIVTNPAPFDNSPSTGEIDGKTVYDPYGHYTKAEAESDAATEYVAVHETSPGIYDPYNTRKAVAANEESIK